MMKAMLFGVVGALSLGLASGCTPSPEDVCAHMQSLAKKELGQKAADQMGEGCVKDLERKKEIKGLIKYRDAAKCIMNATKIEDIRKCG